MPTADLHIHTTASDGQYTPAEILALARENGDDVIAITDHDTMDGAREAQTLAAPGLRVIPGIEFSAAEYGQLHILGYWIDLDDPGLLSLCRSMQEGRDARKYRIIDYLAGKGLTLTLEEVEALAGGAVIGRPHFARAMVARGYVKTNREAFDRYLDTPEFLEKIERIKPPAVECVAAIHCAGGKAVWAHPGLLGFSPEEERALLQNLLAAGLDGIEVRYGKHTPAQTARYAALAAEFGLFATAGSDFHGERVKPGVKLGRYTFDEGDFFDDHH